MSDGFKNLEDDILLSMVEIDDDEGNYQDDLIEKIAQDRLLASIDTKTGAPSNVRAAVSAAQTPDDRLATLKNFYPDALPVEVLDPQDGAAKFGYGNFVFTNPETGIPTLFDEDLRVFGMPVPGLRDLVDVGPEIAETVGAIGGLAGGAAVGVAGGPPGVLVGGLAGEGLGSATAREAYIGILNFFGETEDTRTAGERLIDYGTTAGINAIGGPIINKLFQGVKFVAGQPIRFASGSMSADSKIAKQKLDTVGITNPSAGQVTANPTINLFESALASAPSSTKIMHDNAAQTIKEIDTYAKNLAEKYGGIRTTQEAGELLLDGARAARLRYDETTHRLYSEVNNFMPDNLVSDATNTTAFVNKYLAQSTTATGKPSLNPALRQAERVLQDAKDGVLSYNQLKDFRSSLMANIRHAESQGALSASNRKVKELIGYVTKDLDALVARSENPQALAKYKAANKYVRDNTGKKGGLTYIDNIIKKGEVRSTDALKYVLTGAKDGGEDLIKLRSQLTPDEYSVMSGYMLGRMGLPTPGIQSADEIGKMAQDFSPRTFITNWNKLSKEAKEALFKQTEYEELVPALDDLVFVVDRVGKSASQMANPSGTARVVGALGVLGVGGADIAGKIAGSEGFEYGLGALVAPYVSAKLLTNKSFVNWLAEGVEIAAYNPNSFGQHVRRLYQIYELNPDIREEIRAVTEGLANDTIEPMPQHSATSNPLPSMPVENEQAFREVSNAEVSGKLLPDIQLQQDIDSFAVPSVSSPSFAMSPTIVPDERDREIAMRDMSGINSLV
tara:strand:- start:254 stop:2620 length:2367 start_codon:yes stop_codon:yes gene_type:complete